MTTTRRTRLLIRLQNAMFVVSLLLVVVLVGWLGVRYNLKWDWTATGRNSLSEVSKALLERVDGPVRITSYAPADAQLRGATRELVERYQRHKPDLTLEFIDPQFAPDAVRTLGISVPGELRIELGSRTERVQQLSEQAISDALQRLMRGGERWVVYLTGHGERDLLGEANHDLGLFGRHLEQRGLTIQALDLSQAGAIPTNTMVLVLSGGDVSLLAGETELVRDYVARGGNLLWLTDPGSRQAIEDLADLLGVRLMEGVVVDPSGRVYGISDPSVTILARYPEHPITTGFRVLTVFPKTRAMTIEERSEWTATSILVTNDGAWVESGELRDEISQDTGEPSGPLDVGWALERRHPGDSERTQRVVVVGDGDFLSNAFLGNVGNLDLGAKMFNWLTRDDVLIAIPSKMAPDLSFELSTTRSLLLGFGNLVGIPLVLVTCGLFVWIRRRYR